MGGKPVIRGRRVTPSMVTNMLANGVTRDEVLKAHPVLEPEDIDACLLYAARLSDLAAFEGLTVAAESPVVRILADTNIVAQAVQSLRHGGNEVVCVISPDT